MSTCELCGEPMPVGEDMFKFHGYSGPCPKQPLTAAAPAPTGDGILREALTLIAGEKCSRFTTPQWACWTSGRTKDARYTADKWCDQCIAADALVRALMAAPGNGHADLVALVLKLQAACHEMAATDTDDAAESYGSLLSQVLEWAPAVPFTRSPGKPPSGPVNIAFDFPDMTRDRYVAVCDAAAAAGAVRGQVTFTPNTKQSAAPSQATPEPP